MSFQKLVTLACCTAFAISVAHSAVVLIPDGEFETPVVGDANYAYGATGSAWTFDDGAGVSGNDSDFTAHGPAAPFGHQVAFIQGQGSFGQDLALEAGTYVINFMAVQRRSWQHTAQTFTVSLDGKPIGTFCPVSELDYVYQSSQWFTVSAGTHHIAFSGDNPLGGDNTAFIDHVWVESIDTGLKDGGFEAPAIDDGSYAYGATGSAWSFANGGGISANGSDFTNGNEAAPEGRQVAFIQNVGSASQAVNLKAGAYKLRLSAVQRINFQAVFQFLQVTVDGKFAGYVFPFWFSREISSNVFTVADGSHQVVIEGLNLFGGDNTAFIDDVRIEPVTLGTHDGSFEQPALGDGNFAYAPEGSDWMFLGGAGITSNDSIFTGGNAPAPEGDQVGFVQGDGQLVQLVDVTAGNYAISFKAAQRVWSQESAQAFEVWVDATLLGVYAPAPGGDYETYTTTWVTVYGGTHQITFRGVNPMGGDNTAFIDDVSVEPVVLGIRQGGFENPNVGADRFSSFAYQPTGSEWGFGSGGGISGNGSGFTFYNPAAPEGRQVGLVQGDGSVYQVINLEAGKYVITFDAAQRLRSQDSYQSVSIEIDGMQVGVIEPEGSDYSAGSSWPFEVRKGTHALLLRGLNPEGGDNTVFVDDVQIAPADEGELVAPTANG